MGRAVDTDLAAAWSHSGILDGPNPCSPYDALHLSGDAGSEMEGLTRGRGDQQSRVTAGLDVRPSAWAWGDAVPAFTPM